MKTNTVVRGDCVRHLRDLDDGSVDLAFADPPFNIGFEYDEYDDTRACKDYLSWSNGWMTQVHRVLKDDGTFWLAIGDEYAAELKVMATGELGYTCRSWVVWYYTFGMHCYSKFTRSHTHLFHFVKDPDQFTFNDMAVRVPSARQLVYADKRANPDGRVPDDTWIMRPTPHDSWILRPQDIPEGFTADSDTWYLPRVCGTFKERMGFHGCQMPEQLLGRIIRACSNEGDVVLDPFTGSGTTLAVAKKLARDYVGFELSSEYVAQSRKRLRNARIGDPLDGSESPLVSVSNTANGRSLSGGKQKGHPNGTTGNVATRKKTSTVAKRSTKNRKKQTKGLTSTEQSVVAAFESVGSGFSADRVVADPELNSAFVSELKTRDVPGNAADWNRLLLRLRKANRLRLASRSKRSNLHQATLDQCEFASEIAYSHMQDRYSASLDEILCDPAKVSEFDSIARNIAPGFTSLYYRWAALRIRKYSYDWRSYANDMKEYDHRFRFGRMTLLGTVDPQAIPSKSGLYQLRSRQTILYIGETKNLRTWTSKAEEYDFDCVASARGLEGSTIELRVLPFDPTPFALQPEAARRGTKYLLVGKQSPKWNLLEIAA